ncbi:hypothetical protein LSTR_LSTR001917 [Laodelphax striatellus]|uniref:Uncharacterized protein n=1 Tax=Laodelphax striatellus TaxID=195883 RepID=A0A482XGE8_LAOST|nr:hypothetical protein LSTR_LSTR001917 [Laodelphax striatellus]
MPVAQLPVSYCTMKTTLVVSVFAACVAAILAQPLDQRFRRGIADPDVTFRENEIDSSLQELVRTKKSPKEKASELFIGKGIQKEVSQPQTAAIPSSSDKKEEEVASQVKTSLKDLESEKDGSAKDDADRSRRQQSIFVSPIALDGLLPNMLFRSSVESQLPPKSISQPAIVSPFLEQSDRSIAVPVRPVPVQIINTPDSTHLPHHHLPSEPHGCTCQCATCRPQSSGLYTPLRASYAIEQQQSADDRVKQMRAAEQQPALKQLQLQQQVQLLQQQMDQQRAVDQMQQLQLELQKQKLDEQQRSAADPSSLADPDCAINKLANLQLPKNILSDLIQMEQQRVQKIKDCQGKTDQPQKLEVLSAIVEKEVELLQKQVELLQKSDAEKKKKLDEKKTR